MKRPLSWILIGFVSIFLGACSAASLQKASDNTAVAGWMSPLGAAIHLPLSIAADIANSESTSSTELVPPGSKEETIDGKLVFVPPKSSKSPPIAIIDGKYIPVKTDNRKVEPIAGTKNHESNNTSSTDVDF